jgi:hypothetical protein
VEVCQRMSLRLSDKTEMPVSIFDDEEQDTIEGVSSVLLTGKRQMLQIDHEQRSCLFGGSKNRFQVNFPPRDRGGSVVSWKVHLPS